MKHIAILTGGPSAEREIALNSAKLVENHLDPDKYVCRTILIEKNGWVDRETGVQVDLNRFSLELDSTTIDFDFAFLIVHGTPVEDGKLQGYFESRGIPHSTCDTLTASLTFNKQWCKDFLRAYNIPMASSQVVLTADIEDFDLSAIEYPVFVKPNNNGSSYGVSRVEGQDELVPALKKAAQFDDEIMVEGYLEGREFSSGVVKEANVLHLLPITEIIPEGTFFDYDAKYLGAGQEVTPADLDLALANECKQLSGKLYRLLNCKGMVRFDYILVDDVFFLLEVNTVPGMSEASIIPQQARAYGWTIREMLDIVVDDALKSTL